MGREKKICFYPTHVAKLVNHKIEVSPLFLNLEKRNGKHVMRPLFEPSKKYIDAAIKELPEPELTEYEQKGYEYNKFMPEFSPTEKPKRLYEEFLRVNTRSPNEIINFMNAYNLFFVPKDFVLEKWIKPDSIIEDDSILIDKELFIQLQDQFKDLYKKHKAGKRDDNDFLSVIARKNAHRFVQILYPQTEEIKPVHKHNKIVISFNEKLKERKMLRDKYDERPDGMTKQEADFKIKREFKIREELKKLEQQLREKGILKTTLRKMEQPACTLLFMYDELFNDISAEESRDKKAQKRNDPLYIEAKIESRKRALERRYNKISKFTSSEYALEKCILNLVMFLNNNGKLYNWDGYYFSLEKRILFEQDFGYIHGTQRLFDLARKEKYLACSEGEVDGDAKNIKYNLANMKKDKPFCIHKPESSA